LALVRRSEDNEKTFAPFPWGRAGVGMSLNISYAHPLLNPPHEGEGFKTMLNKLFYWIVIPTTGGISYPKG